MRAKEKSLLLTGVSLITLLALQACSKNSTPDPADANLASANQAPATAAEDQYGQPEGQANYAPTYNQPAYSNEQLTVATQPPPPLPSYSQPPCPGPNYIWTPGYWAYSGAGYYWVPGVWVLAPYVDALWTPPYWGFVGGRYYWHGGYWSPHIGFYGGINYGFGYTGFGYYGGYWNGGAFFYNRDANNVSVRVVRNIYSHSVHNYTPVDHVSFNGGRGGINRAPTAAELAVNRERHFAPVAAQTEHAQQAAADRRQFAAENHGRPATPTVERPLATHYNAPAPAPREWQRNETRPSAPVAGVRQEGPRPEATPARPEPGREQGAPPSPGAPTAREAPERAPGQRFGEPNRAPEQRPATPAETRPAPPQRVEHAAPAPRETRPAPQAPTRMEQRPTPQAQRPEPPRPPQMHSADRAAAPPPRSAPQAHPQARPAPAQARPSPQAPPHQASHPAPPANKKDEHGH
jgi:hypothetical protein